MKKLIKKLLVVIGVVVLILGSFMLGAYAAGNTWKSKVLSKASTDIGKAGYEKKEALLTNIDAVIEERVLAQKNPTIQEKQTEVENELDTYFDGKVTELMQSEEFDTLDSEIDVIKTDVVDRYKAEIDAAFVGK